MKNCLNILGNSFFLTEALFVILKSIGNDACLSRGKLYLQRSASFISENTVFYLPRTYTLYKAMPE